MAEWTGLEPATLDVTGRYSNQLNYHSVDSKPNGFFRLKPAFYRKFAVPQGVLLKAFLHLRDGVFYIKLQKKQPPPHTWRSRAETPPRVCRSETPPQVWRKRGKTPTRVDKPETPPRAWRRRRLNVPGLSRGTHSSLRRIFSSNRRPPIDDLDQKLCELDKLAVSEPELSSAPLPARACA